MVQGTEIEAVQSVIPLKITDPRTVRHVSLSGVTGSTGISGGCVHVVLYYNNATIGGSVHAGWIKESLGLALSEQPLLAGRLQRADEEEEEIYYIVSNDAGARLVEARVGLTMSEFLITTKTTTSTTNKNNIVYNKDAEAELTFWKQVLHDQDPQFSPLLYVQVTKFECGGYSIGISCSLLLADLLFKENFLKRWAEIHKTMLHKENVAPEKPLFYLPSIGIKAAKSNSNIPKVISSSVNKEFSQTMIFNVINSDIIEEEFSTFALLCVGEAEIKLGSKMAEFSSLTYVKEASNNVVKIEECSRDDQLVIKPKRISLKNGINSASWDDFGSNKLEFSKGNGPVCVSHWIGSVSGGLVMAVPCRDYDQCVSGVKIIVRVPN